MCNSNPACIRQLHLNCFLFTVPCLQESAQWIGFKNNNMYNDFECELMISVLFSVTVARAVELKHKASLISALTYETSKLFTAASMFCYPIIIQHYQGSRNNIRDSDRSIPTLPQNY